MEEPDFGKGVAQLLSLTREKGSLSAAYKSMGMAASKAWKILNRAEADLGVKLVERKSGGKQGGGSHLTPEGEDILNRYENFQKEVAEAKCLQKKSDRRKIDPSTKRDHSRMWNGMDDPFRK